MRSVPEAIEMELACLDGIVGPGAITALRTAIHAALDEAERRGIERAARVCAVVDAAVHGTGCASNDPRRIVLRNAADMIRSLLVPEKGGDGGR